MIDKITKFLNKLPKKELVELEKILSAIKSLQFKGLDIKKLKGHSNIFRVKKGRIRVVFAQDKNEIRILKISYRNEKTYKF